MITPLTQEKTIDVPKNGNGIHRTPSTNGHTKDQQLTIVPPVPTTIVKRDGRVVSFNIERIENAITRCFAQLGKQPKTSIPALSQQVVNVVAAKLRQPTVEDVQDTVEMVLQADGEYEAAKSYILYRAEHAKLREARPVPQQVRDAFAESDRYFPSQLQKFQFYDKYSRFNYDFGRRETWVETVNRAVDFLKELSHNRLPEETYERVRKGILEMRAAPSMRLLAMAGPAARRNNIAVYNCSYLPVDCLDAFVEALIISMGGCGVGYSVESQYIESFPRVRRQSSEPPTKFVIPDSAEGWADALRIGLEAWFEGKDISFDYSEIRPAGAPLVIKGGRASGPGPLRQMLDFTRGRILARQGSFIRSIDAHDIMCAVGNAAVSGGVRRTAMIALFDYDDLEMRHCKNGDNIIGNEQRWNANNSAVWSERELSQAEIARYLLDMVESGRGEPGIFSRRAAYQTLPERREPMLFGTNPCITADTVVAVADGRGHVPIGQLAAEDKDVPVYCLDNQGKTVVRWMRHPRLTGTQQAIYEVKLDDGSSIKCTANHKFRLKSGEYVIATELNKGDSLHVMTRFEASIKDIFKEFNARSQDYYWINNGQRANVAEHRLIASFHQNTEILKQHALTLTKSQGRRFSTQEWHQYAKANALPQAFSKWRQDHLGGITGLAKWAALELGLDHIDADPRTVKVYQRYVEMGYDCEIVDNSVHLHKTCEVCGDPFITTARQREAAVCSQACKAKQIWEQNRETILTSLHTAHADRKQIVRQQQVEIFTQLQFDLSRTPLKKEWVTACKTAAISPEIARTSSPFRTYADLKEAASMYNHRVVSVEFVGYEDVYNGTVDEFHNFFVGGWESETTNGKSKWSYVNNLQCGEILLRPMEFCNLSIAIARPDDTFESLAEKVELATIIGTIQSMATHFPGLRPRWRENCEEERLLGVDINGQLDSPVAQDPEVQRRLKEIAVETNRVTAQQLGINQSASVTCVKPSGNSSQLFDCSPGIHTRWAPYYVRNVRVGTHTPLYKVLRDAGAPMDPENGQMPETATTWVIHFPVKAPTGAITRNDRSALEQCEYWLQCKTHWTEHNPSVTITYRPHEILDIIRWVWENQDKIGGMTFLPAFDAQYEQMPYEEIDKETYQRLVSAFPELDFSKVYRYEEEDLTTAAQELACFAGSCEIEF